MGNGDEGGVCELGFGGKSAEGEEVLLSDCKTKSADHKYIYISKLNFSRNQIYDDARGQGEMGNWCE